MSNFWKLTVLGVTLFCSTYANAGGTLSLGFIQYSVQDVEPNYNVSTKPKGMILGWVGSINKYLALDSRYAYSGSASNGNLTINISGISQFLRPQYKLKQGVTLYGLLGYSALSIGRTIQGFGEETGRKYTFSYGLGARAAINDKWEAGLEWVSYMRDTQVGAAGVDIKFSVAGAQAVVGYKF